MLIIKSVVPQILSFSGGKDSTALALWALDCPSTFKVDGVCCFATGWDFSEIEENQRDILARFEKKGIKTALLDSSYIKNCNNHDGKNFTYLLARIRRKGMAKDVTGWGFPHLRNRWCTRIKTDVIKKWEKDNYGEFTELVGLAADELGRIKKLDNSKQKAPLNDAKMTERDCLQMCYDHGIRFGGLYENINRASCFLCPLCNLNQLRYLYWERKELWFQLKHISSLAPWWLYRAGFTVDEYARRFELEREFPTLSSRQILQKLQEETGKTPYKANGFVANLVRERQDYCKQRKE